MSNKKRYRIRKAKTGEQTGVKNPMQQFMAKAQPGMQQPSQEEMAMMQQEQMLQQQAASQSENQIVNAIAAGMQSGVKAEEIIANLLQSNMSPTEISNGFLTVMAANAQNSGQQITAEQGQQMKTQVDQLINGVMQMMQGAAQQEEQAPAQMSKGGYKKKLLKKAKEGREAQAETPGSILPQPATLNTFIEGVKDEGNEFYAKQMSEDVFAEPNQFRRGGPSNRKLARLASKQDPYSRSDRRALRRGLKSGEFTEDDLNASIASQERLIPSTPDYNAIYKDLGTMSADYLGSLMPTIFSHRNKDNEFSREGTGLEDTNVDIYFKKKGFGRREWGISGLDYTSLPAYGGLLGTSAVGSGYGTTRNVTRRVIPGVTVAEGVRDIANNVNDANDDTQNAVDDRKDEIDTKESVFDMVQTQPSAAEEELNRKFGIDEDGLFFDKNPYDAWQDMPFSSEGTPTIADTYGGVNAPRPEEVIKTTEEEQETTTEVAADNLGVTDDMSFSQAFRTARDNHGGKGGEFIWKGKKYGTALGSEMPKEGKEEKALESWRKKDPTGVYDYVKGGGDPDAPNEFEREGYVWKDNAYWDERIDSLLELGYSKEEIYKIIFEEEGFDSYDSKDPGGEKLKKWLESYPGWRENTMEEKKIRMNRLQKEGKERNDAKHAKNAKTKEAAIEYFKRAEPRFKKEPRYYKIVDRGNGRFDLEYARYKEQSGGGNAKSYSPSSYNRSAFPNLAEGGQLPEAQFGIQKVGQVAKNVVPAVSGFLKNLPIYKVNPFAQKTLPIDYAVGTPETAFNYFRDFKPSLNKDKKPIDFLAYKDAFNAEKAAVDGIPQIRLSEQELEGVSALRKFIQENPTVVQRFARYDELPNFMDNLGTNLSGQDMAKAFPFAMSVNPTSQDAIDYQNMGLLGLDQQSPSDFSFKRFSNLRGWVDAKPKDITKMINQVQVKAKAAKDAKIDPYEAIGSKAINQGDLDINKAVTQIELELMNDPAALNGFKLWRFGLAQDVPKADLIKIIEAMKKVDPTQKLGSLLLSDEVSSLEGNPLLGNIRKGDAGILKPGDIGYGKEGTIDGADEGLRRDQLEEYMLSGKYEGIDASRTRLDPGVLENQRLMDAYLSGPIGQDPEVLKTLLFSNISGRSMKTPFGKNFALDPKRKANNIFTGLNRFGGNVSPELYKYIYGGDEIDPDMYKDITDPYFAPGGAFKKPKMDPVLGPMSPTAEVQKYRETVYPTSKGIFGQVKDYYKEMLQPITQGQGIKGVAKTIGNLYAPKQFTYLTKPGDPKSAYGYIGVDGLPNTIARSYENAIYDDQGNRIVGKSTDVQYKDKLFGKDKITITDSATKVKRDKDGNIIDTEYKGFYDEFTGNDSGFLNFDEDGQNRLGGLNKFIMAGEIDADFMEDQNAPNVNMVENTSEEEEFNLADCTEAELQRVGSDCYNAATRSEEYKANTARTTNNPLIANTLGFLSDATVDFSTSVDNAKRDRFAFGKTTSDSKAKQVSYDVGQGFDAITGYQSMVDSQFNEPVRVSSARPRGMNPFATRGGQYAVGGVYDLTPQQIDAIYAAGGSIEIIQ